MISNSTTASSTSFFTLLPHWLQLVHLQSWTSSATNHLSKQFSKLATPLSDTGTSIQLKTSFLIDWYLQLLHCRTDETLPWYLGNACMPTCLACTGCIAFRSVLCTHLSNTNTCSYKFLPSFLTNCLGLVFNDEAPSERQWNIAFM